MTSTTPTLHRAHYQSGDPKDPEIRAQFGRFERRSSSPGAASAYLRTLAKIDVRDALPLISAPTLILHPTRDRAIPIAIARYTAARIPGAVLKELDTADHLIWFSEAIDAITDEIQDFVTAAVAADEIHRVLARRQCRVDGQLGLPR